MKPLKTIINRYKYKCVRTRLNKLHGKMLAMIVRLLNDNGGCITFQPDLQAIEGSCVEYPITMTFYGKHDNPDIEITDVHLDSYGEVKVDGINTATGCKEYDFELCFELCKGVLDFIAKVLGYKQDRH